MVVVAAGRFSMDCLSNGSGCYDDEQPVHGVSLPNNFAMAVYEVTFDMTAMCRPREPGDRMTRDGDAATGR